MDPPPPAPSPLLLRITALLDSLHASLAATQPLTLTLTSLTTGRPTHISFPAHARKFAIHLSLLTTIRDLLTTQTTATKRDIYYRNVPLFQHQRTVDVAVDTLAATFAVRREDLNIRAAGKGVFVSSASGGVRIIEPGVEVSVGGGIRWALLVEKEAVFQQLAGAVWPGGVVVTGKGYPDLATRGMLSLLEGRGVRVLAVVDFDVDGFEIVQVVRGGGRRLGHEGIGVRAGGTRWLGVGWGEVVRAVERDGGVGLVPMSVRDRRRAVGMMERFGAEWRENLQRMLFVGFKAEIEILGDELEGWVRGRVDEVVDGE